MLAAALTDKTTYKLGPKRAPHIDNKPCAQMPPELRLTFNNSIDRTAFLAETTVDALGHVNIISSRPAAAILSLLCFNGNGLGWADCLAKFASDTPFFTRGISTQCVFATEARGNRTLFEGIVDCVPVAGIDLVSIPIPVSYSSSRSRRGTRVTLRRR